MALASWDGSDDAQMHVAMGHIAGSLESDQSARHDCCPEDAVSYGCDCVCVPLNAITATSLKLQQSPVDIAFAEPLSAPYPIPLDRALRPPIL